MIRHMVTYAAHKAYTVTLEFASFLMAGYVILLQDIDTWVRALGALVAVVVGICAVIRAIWEIKIKRREHRKLELELREMDQKFWANLQIKNNGDNTSKSIPTE